MPEVKQITVISGKGGTGKTSLVGAFAALSQSAVLADCDVDAANLHLLICDPQAEVKSEPFTSGSRAKVDRQLCIDCGWCETVCRFDAIHVWGDEGSACPKAAVDLFSCEGCGVCCDGCPTGAVELREQQAGELLVTKSRFGFLVHARLKPGEGSSGKLVTKVRIQAKDIADDVGAGLVLVDGSPGIGCPVIASIAGVDGVLVVTEPTQSGRSDLERVLDLCEHFALPAFVIVNKWDLSEEVTESIQEVCRSKGIALLGRIRFDPAFVDAVASGRTILEICGNDTVLELRRIWSKMLEVLNRETSADARPRDLSLNQVEHGLGKPVGDFPP